MDARYIIVFVADETPSFRKLLERGVECGLSTVSDDRDDVVEQYEVDYQRQTDDSLDEALDDLSQASRASVSLWAPSGMKLRLSTSEVSEVEVDEWHGRVDIGFQTTEIDHTHRDQATLDENLALIYSLVKSLTRVVEPEFVWSAVVDDNDEWKRKKPDGRPIRDTIEDLSWITVLSESNVDQFGGREHVLQTPAHRVEELESGHVVLMLEDHPYEPSADSHGNWKQHLLGG